MATLTVRGLEEETYERLKRQAKANGRSLEAEVRQILRHVAQMTLEESGAYLEQRRIERFGDRVFSDSTPLIREDREA